MGVVLFKKDLCQTVTRAVRGQSVGPEAALHFDEAVEGSG
jgi:hypothetical protein